METSLLILSSALVAAGVYITRLHILKARTEDVLKALLTGELKVVHLNPEDLS